MQKSDNKTVIICQLERLHLLGIIDEESLADQPAVGQDLNSLIKLNNCITMSLNIKPIAGTANRVVVQAAPAETVTASGIYIPETAQEKPQKGTVISVSEEDADGKKPTVKSGDTVLYGKYAGTEITYEGKEYLIMRETDIYAVL